MRHRKKFNHLSRTSAHRRAMLSNMSTSLILHKRIKTTVAKAKALRSYVEPILSRSKVDTTHSRRMVFSSLQSKEAVNELFREISTKIASRPGGYTRIIKLGNRMGDNADMCLIELVDYNEHMLGGGKTERKATTGRRRRRKSSGADKETTRVADVVKETTVVDEPKAEVEDVKEEKSKPEVAAEEKSSDDDKEKKSE